MVRSVIVLLAIAGVARADEGALTAHAVKTGLFMISGGGCNSVLRLSGNGFILVDGKLPGNGNYEAILAKVKKISFSDQPIRVLITMIIRGITTATTRSSWRLGPRSSRRKM